MKRILPLTFTAALQSSCMMGPDFLGATAPELPATWVNAQPPGTSEHTLDEWWHCFRDPQLTRLIEGGFAANPDMVSAALAIEKAESALRSTRSGLFPSLGMSFGGTNSGNGNTAAEFSDHAQISRIEKQLEHAGQNDGYRISDPTGKQGPFQHAALVLFCNFHVGHLPKKYRVHYIALSHQLQSFRKKIPKKENTHPGRMGV